MKKQILAVDDSKAIRFLLQTVFRNVLSGAPGTTRSDYRRSAIT
jgi:hypothetical protein